MNLSDFVLSETNEGSEYPEIICFLEATNTRNKQKFSVTKVDREMIRNIPLSEQLRKHVELLGYLDHKNIQSYFDCFYENNYMFLFLEYQTNSFYSMFDEKQYSEERDIFEIFHQIIDVVSYLHDNDIVHLDIQPKTFFFTTAKTLKMGNFYNAEFVTGNKLISKPYGTLNFAPPDSKKGQEYDGKAADVWACGVLLLSMLNRQLAITGTSEDEVNKSLINGTVYIPKRFSSDIKHLLQVMTSSNPFDRPSINDIYQSEWFRRMSN